MTEMFKDRLADVIRRPLITEKATRGIESNQYSFEVDPRAAKPDIKAATTNPDRDILSLLAIPVPVVRSKKTTSTKTNKAKLATDMYSRRFTRPNAGKTRTPKEIARRTIKVANPEPVSTVEPTSN